MKEKCISSTGFTPYRYKSMDPVTNLQKEMIISVCGAVAQLEKEQELW